MKELSGFVSPGKISYSYTNAKMRAIIHKKALASGAQWPPYPSDFSRALSLDPTRNCCFPDPVT